MDVENQILVRSLYKRQRNRYRMMQFIRAMMLNKRKHRFWVHETLKKRAEHLLPSSSRAGTRWWKIPGIFQDVTRETGICSQFCWASDPEKNASARTSGGKTKTGYLHKAKLYSACLWNSNIHSDTLAL